MLVLREFNSTLIYSYNLSNLRLPPPQVISRFSIDVRVVIRILKVKMDAVLDELAQIAHIISHSSSPQMNTRQPVHENLRPMTDRLRRRRDPALDTSNCVGTNSSRAFSDPRSYSKLMRRILDKGMVSKIFPAAHSRNLVLQNSSTSDSQLLLELKRIMDERITEEGAFRVKPHQCNDAHSQIITILQNYEKKTFSLCP